MAPRPSRSISGPIFWGSISSTLTVALLVGWVYVVLKNQALTQQWVANLWLLVGGVVSFIAITTVLILFSVFFARQIVAIRRQTAFIDSVTHELRSPLASIQLGLQTLGRQGLDNRHKEQLREMMLDDTERLAAFIDDILEATRLEYGRAGQLISRVKLRALTMRCVTAIVRRHKLEACAITVEIPPDLELRTDPTALETVLKNLLDNAIKYSDPPVEVRVDAHARRDGRVQLRVSDRGVGIPAAALGRIFDRFYRADEEAVRARRGTGLGLFVAHALVKDMGGKLRAHSAGPGLGTQMTVLVPHHHHEPVARGAAPNPGAQA